MPTYRAQFTEVISYDVTFTTKTPIDLDEQGYPDSEEDWFGPMEAATSTWPQDCITNIGGRELDAPIEIVEDVVSTTPQ